MWTSATTDMIITGIGQTLYMTILSTVVGYVFGLPLGVMLQSTGCNFKYHTKHTFPDSTYSYNTFNKINCRSELWFISNSSSIGCCGNSIYRSNG